MERSIKKDELISIIRERNPLLADAVSHMMDYVTDKYPAAYPNKEQTEACGEHEGVTACLNQQYQPCNRLYTALSIGMAY